MTLSLSGTLAAGTEIAISGLLGATHSAGVLALSFPPTAGTGPPTAGDVFGAAGAWNDASGTVTLTLADAALENAVYVLAFSLVNQIQGQAPQAVFVEAAGVVVRAQPSTPNP